MSTRLASSNVLVFTLAMSLNSHAQSMNAPDSPCQGVVVTSDLVKCLNQALNASDAKLNSAYTQVQRALSAEEAKTLVQAQRYWIQFRDATCKAEYNLYGGGTGGPPTRLACLEAETRAREASLQRSFGWRVQKSGR